MVISKKLEQAGVAFAQALPNIQRYYDEQRRDKMKSVKLLQLIPDLIRDNWYVVAVYTTKEDICWAVEFAHSYPQEFRVEVVKEQE